MTAPLPRLDANPAFTQGRSLVRSFAPFLACAGLLALLAAAFHIQTRHIYFRKEALPIKRSLDLLDRSKLDPYEVIRKNQIEPETLNALGTREYIQWDLEDTDLLDKTLPQRYVNLFVTYYTGQPDPVPHVPEACHMGAGLLVEEEHLEELEIPNLPGRPRINVHVLRFAKPPLLGKKNLVVLYLFKANGSFTYDRTSTRKTISSPAAKYGYFSKVELKFGRGDSLPDEAVAIEAAKKLCRVLIPVLQREHWPDWDPKVHEPG